MKKSVFLSVAACSLMTLVACGNKPAASSSLDPNVMTHAQFVAAPLETKVIVETYVQDKQAYWEKDGSGKGTFYTQAKDGAYFVYEAGVTKELYDQLVPGTKIKVEGYRAEWSGEMEITDPLITVIPNDTWIAPAFDATSLLGTDTLIDHQNERAAFKNLTVVAQDAEHVVYYKWDNSGSAEANSDIYFKVNDGKADYVFTVESYLRGKDTEVYKKVAALKAGDKIDVESFLYWYNGAQPHVYDVTVK